MFDESDPLAVMHGLREGSRDAWTALYRRYNADVWRYVARLVGPSSTEVADVVQETFLAAARSARQFDAGKGTPWSWLIGIAHRQAALVARRNHRATRIVALAESGAVTIRTLLETDHAADALGDRRELAELVRWVLGELSAEYAGLLAGKYLDEFSLEMLSQQWGGSVEATKSKLARARHEFRELFERVTRSSLTTAD